MLEYCKTFLTSWNFFHIPYSHQRNMFWGWCFGDAGWNIWKGRDRIFLPTPQHDHVASSRQWCLLRLGGGYLLQCNAVSAQECFFVTDGSSTHRLTHSQDPCSLSKLQSWKSSAMFVKGVEHTHKDSKGASDFILTNSMRHTQLLRTRDLPPPRSNLVSTTQGCLPCEEGFLTSYPDLGSYCNIVSSGQSSKGGQSTADLLP